MHHPTDRIAHTTAFVTPVVEHWLEREIEFSDVIKVASFSVLVNSGIFKILFISDYEFLNARYKQCMDRL